MANTLLTVTQITREALRVLQPESELHPFDQSPGYG